MQDDPKKLAEANCRRVIGKIFSFTALALLTPYLMYLVSGGYRNPYGLGHYWFGMSITLLLIAFVIIRPVFTLENPFLSSLKSKIDNTSNNRIPIHYLLLGIIGCSAWLAFYIWVIYSIYFSKGLLYALFIAVLIGVPAKVSAIPQILRYLNSKRPPV